MDIEYRTYEPGDEAGLTDAFNFPFSRGGLMRTPARVRWRYVTPPRAKPGEIQVAYDKDAGKIAGAVYSTIGEYQFDGVPHRTGSINDVGTLPEYTGHGIGRKLMEQAVAFMRGEGCEYSALSADPKGFPRSKLYIPLGWKDVFKEQVWLSVIGTRPRTKLGTLLSPTFPALLASRAIRSLRIHRIAMRLANLGIKARIALPWHGSGLDRALSRQIWHFHEAVAPRQMDGFVHFSLDDWIYFREKPCAIDLWPVYAVITRNGEVAGYANFMKQRMSRVFGMRFPIGFGREFLVDHAITDDPVVLADVYTLLAGKIWEAAIRDSCFALVYLLAPNDTRVARAFKTLGYLHVPAGVFMVNNLHDPGAPLPLLTRPFLVDPADNFGYP
jgi:ribosomal protein S18 acetylase RimI-like enzyme